MSIAAAEFADQAEAFFKDKAPGAPVLFVPNAMGANNAVSFRYTSLDQAFPPVDPEHIPLGSLVLVQVRHALSESAGGIIIDTETRKTERDNTQVAKVISYGPIAFCNRNTGAPWPEGAWCQPGDFVRIPKYQGERWSVNVKLADGKDEAVEFALFKDIALLAKITNPLSIRSYL